MSENKTAVSSGELMIGNWVYYGYGKHYQSMVFVESIRSNFIGVQADDNSASFVQNIQEFSGMPLTPEILEKCGFVKDGDEDISWYQKDLPVIGELCTSDGSRGEYLFDMNTDTLRIYYLHQLQNLYFCLTGEHLKIEL